MLSKDNIKNDVKGTGCEEVEWIQLVPLLQITTYIFNMRKWSI